MFYLRYVIISLSILLFSCATHDLKEIKELAKISIIKSNHNLKMSKLENYVTHEINPNLINIEKQYRIKMNLASHGESDAVLPDSRISSYKMISTLNYELFEGDKIIYQSQLKEFSSHDPSDSAYSDYFSKENVEENNLRNLAQMLKLDLIMFFKNRENENKSN